MDKMANKNILITYDEFEKHINAICAEQELQLKLGNAFDKYNDKIKDCASLWFPSLESNLVELLQRVTGYKDGWISYRLYELYCGERYYCGCVTIDEAPVVLKTDQDLWALLNGKPHFESGLIE